MIHDFPLAAWITASISKESLRGIMDGIMRDAPIDRYMSGGGAAYTTHILKEEVSKQFSHRYRPVVEAILNSVDAGKHAGHSCQVRVDATAGTVRVRDDGEAMALDDILRYLIIPFATQKDQDKSGDYIGQFGLGFLSTLQYCLEQPGEASVTVLTSKGTESFDARFYATGKDVATVRLRLRRRGTRQRGTSVTIETGFKLDVLEPYVYSQLSGISAGLAQIYYNGKPVNRVGDAWYAAPANLVDDIGRTCEQQIMVQGNQEQRINLTSVGVSVKSFETPVKNGMNVLFPRLVSPTIGRDDFVRNENYYRAVDAAFVALERMIEAARGMKGGLDHGQTRQFVELVPAMLSALGLESLKSVKNVDALAERLIPGKRYVLPERDFLRWAQFVDTGLAFPASPQACAVWGGRFGSYDNFLRDRVPLVREAPAADFAIAARSELADHPNLDIILDPHPSQFQVQTIALVNPEPNDPFLYDVDRRVLYANLRHECLSGPKDSLKRNMVFVRYLETMGLSSSKGYDDLEKQMLRASGRMIA